MADTNNTGGMIALVPADPEALAVAGGDPADQLHLTLAYLGDDVGSMSDATREALKRHVSNFAQDFPAVQGKIMAHAVYNPDGEEHDPATVYQLQHHDHLTSAADHARQLAQQAMGADFPQQHPGFLPHVTAGYGLDPKKLSATGPVTFDRARLALGDEVHDFPLRSPMEGGAIPAFAAVVADTPDDKADVEVPDLDENSGVPLNFPVIIVEGMATSDGRYIEPGSLSHRALPLPILAQTVNPVGGQGHDGAEVVGRLDVLERVPGEDVQDKETGEPFPAGTFVWRGSGYGDPEARGIQLAQKGYLTGNSADLVDVTAAVGDEVDGKQRISLSDGQIAATTLVPIPAFAQAYVEVGGEALTPNEETITAAAVPSWRTSELGDDCALCAVFGHDGFAVTAAKRKKAAANGHALPDGSYPIDTVADLAKAIKAVGRGGADHDKIRKHIITQAKRLHADNMIPDNWKPDGSLTAAATLAAPPAWAFEDPKLEELTPLTIDGAALTDGYRVYGHLAGWNTCHTGFTSKCVLAPHSGTDYSYFHVGAVRTEEGTEVATGTITMGEGGHAGTALSAVDAAKYYDNVNTVVADVVAGEDEFGIWVAGVVRPTATEEQVAALRAAPLSGDWRNIQGNLELVAALAVNTPGFPIPRARIASGVPESLVAAGVVPQVGGESNPAASGSVMLDYDQLGDAIARRIAYHQRNHEVLGVRHGSALRTLELDLDSRGKVAEFSLGGKELSDRAGWAELALELEPSDIEFAKKGNWVEQQGGLPSYIKRIAKHLVEKGMDQSRAIATAVNAAKKMCATGDTNFPGKQEVNPGSKAEACAAVASWEKKKAASHAS